jgi:hypothetical protein
MPVDARPELLPFPDATDSTNCLRKNSRMLVLDQHGHPVADTLVDEAEAAFNAALAEVAQEGESLPSADGGRLGVGLADLLAKKEGRLCGDDPVRQGLFAWNVARLEGWVGGPAGDMSLEEADNFYGHAGAHATRDFMPRGAYGPMIEAYSRGLDIRFGQRIARICWRGGEAETKGGDAADAARATVVTHDGARFACRCVVVTVPVAVLQAGAIAFEPPLPCRKLEAIGRVGMGLFNKVFMEFERAFWPEDKDVLGFLPPPPPADGPPPPLPPLYINLQSGTLVALLCGQGARAIESLGDEEALEVALRPLRAAFPACAADRPCRFKVTRWASDDLAGGTYTYLKVGGVTADRADYAASLDGCLYFAGEGTNLEHPACVDGACETGARAAREIYMELAGIEFKA